MLKKGVVSGFQADGTCVLNTNTFIAPNGGLLDPSETGFVWLNRDLVHESSKVISNDIITPMIAHPLTTEPLWELYSLCDKMAKHNLIPTLLMIAGGIQSFHYHTIINAFGCCPIPVALGESETGKSTTVTAALALFGCDDIGMSVKMTNAILMERACSASLPFGIEEGKGASSRSKTNQIDITEVIMDLSNGSS